MADINAQNLPVKWTASVSWDKVIVLDSQDGNKLKIQSASLFQWPQGTQGVQWPTWATGATWPQWSTGATGVQWPTWPTGIGISSVTSDKVWLITTVTVTKTDSTSSQFQIQDGSGWDMYKSIYDTNTSGVVDDSEKLGGQLPATYEKVANKWIANGYASLDSTGKLPTTQLPDLAINDVFTVASQTTMLALTAQTGDMAIRTDLSKTFVLAASPASTLANWKELAINLSSCAKLSGGNTFSGNQSIAWQISQVTTFRSMENWMQVKNSANVWWIRFSTFVDADNVVVWNRKWSLLGYPLKTSDGTPWAYEDFISCEFDTYDGNTTYTKKITLNSNTLQVNGQNWTSAWTSFTPNRSYWLSQSATWVSCTWHYKVIGKTCFVQVRFNWTLTSSGAEFWFDWYPYAPARIIDSMWWAYSSWTWWLWIQNNTIHPRAQWVKMIFPWLSFPSWSLIDLSITSTYEIA